MPSSLPYADGLLRKMELSSWLDAALFFVCGAISTSLYIGWDDNQGILIAKWIN
jgi:hypothetical protein